MPQLVRARCSADALRQLSTVLPETVAVPELDHLQQIRQAGEPLQAIMGLSRVLETIEKQPSFDERHRYLWVRTNRQMLDCLADLRRTSDLRPMLTRFSNRIKSSAWQQWKKDIGPQYQRLIQLNVHLQRHQEALDVYDECHSLVELDEDTFRSLALAAAGLERGDDGAIELYLRYLREQRRQGKVHRATIIKAARKALRIDLSQPAPERIERLIRANQRLHAVTPLLWSQAHCAVGYARLGRRGPAIDAARKCVPMDEAGAETLLLLGMAFALLHVWDKARDMFQHAAALGVSDQVSRFFGSLANLHEALMHPETHDDRAALCAAIRQWLPDIAAPPTPELAMDEKWVRLHAALVLDDAKLQDEALSAVPVDEQALRWRHMSAWTHAAWDRGRLDAIRAWAQQMDQSGRLPMLLGNAANAAANLLDANAETARPAAALAAQLGEDPLLAEGDADVRASSPLLPKWVALMTDETVPATTSTDAAETDAQPTSAAPVAEAEVGDTEPNQSKPQSQTMSEGADDNVISATAAADYSRFEAAQAVLQGRFDRAALLLEDRAHDAGPLWLHDHWRAVVFAHQGRVDEAAAAMQGLATRHPSHPIHLLIVGLWKLARNEMAEAIAALSTIPPGNPCRLDALLGLAPAHLALEDASAVKAFLAQAVALFVQPGCPRPFAFRPWRMLVDVADWHHGIGRAADGCHLAECCIKVGDIEAALLVLRSLAGNVPMQAGAARQRIGRVADDAALSLIAQGAFDAACKARDLARSFTGDRPQFALELAAAILETGALELSDTVLTHLVEHAAAGDDASFLQSAVASLLEKALIVTEQQPVAEGEMARRLKWARELARLRPTWSWPHRNLARAALRCENHRACLDHLAAIAATDVVPEDHALRGWAFFNDRRLEEASKSFGMARDGGFAADICRPMAAGCKVLHGWIEGVDIPDADSLLPELELAPRGDDSPWRRRATEWAGPLRAALLIALNRFAQARDAVESEVKAASPQAAVLLTGLIELRSGDRAAALALWTKACEEAPPANDVHVVLLWITLGQPGFAHMASMEQSLLDLHRGGRDDQPYYLLKARFLQRCGRHRNAEESLNKAAAARPKWQHAALHLLDAQLAAEAAFAASAGTLAAGNASATRLAIAEIKALWFSQDRLQCQAALAAARAGDIEAAGAFLQPLAAAKDVDAVTLSAWLAAHRGNAKDAKRLADEALESETDHPFALAVRARLESKPADAVAFWTRLSRAPALVPPEFRVAAHAAMGRFAEAANDASGAVEHYQRARQADPAAALPVSRWCRLAARAGSGDRAAALAAAATIDPARRDLGMLVAMGKLAAHLHEETTLADVLDQIVSHPMLTSLPAAVRSAATRWSAHVHLRQGGVAEAARAIRALLEEEDSPELRSALVDCRLLEMHELMRDSSKPDRFKQLAEAAEDVLKLDPNHQLALLLAATAMLLCGQTGARHAEVVALFKTDWPTADLTLLVKINRLFTEKSDPAGIESIIDQLQLSDSARTYLLVLAANQHGDVKRLLPIAEQAIKGGMAAADLPVAVADLACFAARSHLAKRKHKDAIALLQRVHDDGVGHGESDRLHAIALVRGGIALIKQQRLIPARHNFQQAISLLESAAAGTTAP